MESGGNILYNDAQLIPAHTHKGEKSGLLEWQSGAASVVSALIGDSRYQKILLWQKSRQLWPSVTPSGQSRSINSASHLQNDVGEDFLRLLRGILAPQCFENVTFKVWSKTDHNKNPRETFDPFQQPVSRSGKSEEQLELIKKR